MDLKRSFFLLYLSIGSVDLVDHISQQDFLINNTAEFLILGVFADLQVVSFEGLIHTVMGGEGGSINCVHLRGVLRLHWEIKLLISSFIKRLTG